MTWIRAYWALVGAFAAVVALRVSDGDGLLDSLRRETEYEFEESVTVFGAPGEFQLSVFIPIASDRIDVIDERFEADDLLLDTVASESGRRLLIGGGRTSQAKSVRYVARIAPRATRYHIDDVSLSWRDLDAGDPTLVVPTEKIQSDSPLVQERLAKILRLDEAPETPAAWRDLLVENELAPMDVVAASFEECRDRILGAGFSATTDAVTTLRLGEASCGGKSRLFLAFARATGIPGRLVGGVILGNSRAKRTTHVWTELRLGNRWVPFDPLNDQYAALPSNYLPLYRGDEPLLKHSRGLAFDYGFASREELVPLPWHADDDPDRGDARRVPHLARRHFTILLLAPFALLFVVFARQIVGIRSIGMFLPVLLGWFLVETGWVLGSVQVLGAIGVGVGFRFALSRLHVLHVPRAAILISFLVILFLALSSVFEWMGLAPTQGRLLLPLAALAMTVERFTVSSMDQGTRAALVLLGETLLLAAASALILQLPLLKSLLVAFPEILLLVIAEILAIGHYRGLRGRELWRFRTVFRSGPATGEAIP